MTEKCLNAEVRDALPDLLNGRLSALDTATMNAHLESCAECRADFELLREIREAAPLAPAMNSERISATVPAYGRGTVIGTRPVRTTVISRLGVLRIAAAALVVIGGSWALLARSSDDSVPAVATVEKSTVAPSAPASATTAPELNPGSAAARPTSSAEVQVAALSLFEGTSELSDADLEQLVTDLEAMEAVPSNEPHSVTSTIDDIGADQ